MKRPHLTGEYDVASFFELPAKELFDLKNKPSVELLDSLYHIIKNMAVNEYVTRVDNALSEQQKRKLSALASNEEKEIPSIMSPAIGHFFNSAVRERADVWFEYYFKPALMTELSFVENKAFALEFEKALVDILMLRKRMKKLRKMEKKCFFRKRRRIQKLIKDIIARLSDKSVGYYGVLLYGFTLYSERSSNYLMFDMCFRRES